MPSPRTPSRVTIPCRSSSSSASVRRSGRPAKSRSVGDHRPCVEVMLAARWREHRRLPERDRQRQALEGDERFAERRAAIDALPRRQEAAERSLLRRLDLSPQRRKRSTAQPAQYVWIAPFAFRAAGAQLAADEL